MNRREYPLRIIVNGIPITRIIIDPHYEKKHSESINDQLILELVEKLNGNFYEEEMKKFPYTYYVVDHMSYLGKSYKLIWLLEKDEFYIGIINAYRR